MHVPAPFLLQSYICFFKTVEFFWYTQLSEMDSYGSSWHEHIGFMFYDTWILTLTELYLTLCMGSNLFHKGAVNWSQLTVYGL
jgi:hypothetical protein